MIIFLEFFFMHTYKYVGYLYRILSCFLQHAMSVFCKWTHWLLHVLMGTVWMGPTHMLVSATMATQAGTVMKKV